MSHSLAVFALVLASLPSCSALPAAVDAVDARFLVLPPPRSILASGAPRALSADFSVTATGLGSSSPLLAAAMLREGARLREAIAAAGPTASDASALTGIVLDVASSDETLDVRADYSYTLTADAGSATVHATARSVFGALSALTSLRQLASRGGGGALPHAAIAIDDAPDWPHRGIMIDSGRRFFPVPLVETLIDTMQLLKMSLLHLHVSDECRFGIQSKLFPNLTAGLIGDYAGFYTQDDIRGLVTYGLARGVRIMFEMDIPGHSKGLLPLQQYGAVFCDPTDSTCSQMYGDPANKTYNVLTALLGEMVPLFVEPVVHIGADETGVVGVCTIESTFAVERLVLDFIQNDLHRTPAGWEELLFDANAATPETVIYAWSRHNPASITSQGYQTVNNNASHFYTTAPGGSYPEGWERFYFDIAQGLTPAERQLLQGGEVSQWTDTCVRSGQPVEKERQRALSIRCSPRGPKSFSLAPLLTTHPPQFPDTASRINAVHTMVPCPSALRFFPRHRTQHLHSLSGACCFLAVLWPRLLSGISIRPCLRATLHLLQLFGLSTIKSRRRAALRAHRSACATSLRSVASQSYLRLLLPSTTPLPSRRARCPRPRCRPSRSVRTACLRSPLRVTRAFASLTLSAALATQRTP